jgi:hypothetical protein
VVDGRGGAVYAVEGNVVVGNIVGCASGLDLYDVDGKGNALMSSWDGERACDIRRPICTVADDAIEESRRCRGPPV